MIEVLGFLILPLSFSALGAALLYGLPLFRGQDLKNGWTAATVFLAGILLYDYYWFAAALFHLADFRGILIYLALTVFAFRYGKKGVDAFRDGVVLCIQHTKKADLLVKSFLGITLVILAATFLRCAAPYIEGDSLVYHLFLPKQFVLKGGLWHVPYSEHAFWPLLAEMGFLPGEILRSLFLSKYFSYLIYTLAGLTAGLFVYREVRHFPASLLAAALVVSSPVFFFHAPSTYNDTAFGLFAAASLLALWSAHTETPRKHAVWAGLSGIFAGGALACKYLGFYHLLAIAPVLLWTVCAKKRFLSLLCFAGGVLVTGLPFYVRSYLEYGNPVFPFAQGIFNTPFGYGLERVGLVGSNLSDFPGGTGRGLVDFVMLPVNLVFRAGEFGGERIGPLLLAGLPLVFFDVKRNRPFLLYIVLYTAVWFFLSQYARYLAPVFILTAVAAGFGFAAFAKRSRHGSRVYLAVMLSLAIFQGLWAGYHVYKDFFLRKEDPVKEVAAWAHREIQDPSRVVLVVGEERLYYFDFVAFRERTFRNFTRYPDNPAPQDTLKMLDDAQVRYVLIGQPPDAPPPQDGFNPQAYFTDLTRGSDFEEIDSKVSREGLRYTLYSRK